MERLLSNWALVLASCLALSGCFLEIEVGEGGEVQSASGLSDCAEGAVCSIEISDADFIETFVAVPKSGYRFVGWDDGEDYQCNGSFRTICTVDNTGFSGNAQAAAVIASDKKYFLRPIFEPLSQARFVFIDSEGNEFGETVDTNGAGGVVKLVFTDESGVEHGYRLGINAEGIGREGSENRALWDEPGCAGDPTHVRQNPRRTGMSPLFSQEYVLVQSTNFGFGEGTYHLVKLAPSLDAQDITTYSKGPDFASGGMVEICTINVDEPGTLKLPITVVLRDLASIFPGPFTLEKRD